MSMDPVPENVLQTELVHLLNKHSAENESSTPDFILAEYLIQCLAAFNYAVRYRATWYGCIDYPGKGSVPFPPTQRLDLT